MLLKCRYLVVLALCVVITNVSSTTIIETPKATNPNWWKEAVIYQIYPRTFRDSNKDGVGDLQGIVEKLNHLKQTGITAIWLSPIHEGPTTHKVDFGYEVVNYEKIDQDILKNSDFDKFVEEAHKLGIKVILEFVPNHSSAEHPWFVSSRDDKHAEFDKYKEYYVWRNGKENAGKKEAPNNWKNHLGESAWTYIESRKQWYLHQFAEEQPDLNYRNAKLKEAIEKALEFWLGKNVDGFLIDSAPYLVESNGFEDESFAGERTQNQKETLGIIADWRKVIDKFNQQNPNTDPRILITNAKTDIKKVGTYCGERNIKRAHFTLNNLLLSNLEGATTAASIIKIIDNWISNVSPDCTANWVLGNHDLHRVASRFGPERGDGLNILTAFLPGIMITNNGEEIGQLNGEVKRNQGRDPIACSAVTEEEFQKKTRDLGRTPFHWSSAANAGFSEGRSALMWLPVSSDYETNNLEDQDKPAVKSHYHTYQELIKLRQKPGFVSAGININSLQDSVIGISKIDNDENIYVAVINIGNKKETIDLSIFPNLNKHMKIILANAASRKHTRVLTTNNIELEPYESFVATTISDVEEGDADWWKHAVIYQIYPLSFKDKNNDGFGDLQGIISELDHLKDAGVTAAWLSPIFKSPQVDQGYDISDFKDIDSLYGTLDDFKELVQKAHELKIKIILDFVPNHSSDQHEWFQKSVKGDAEYKDFYIWKDGRGIGKLNPPNNWVSHFRGKAWTRNKDRKQFYLHQFAEEQPDLNYRNPVVVEHMKDVLKFWLDLGVDGFRMDAVPYLFENNNFEDEPIAENGAPAGEYDSLKHIYTSDQPETFDMVYQWREFIEDYNREHGNDIRIMMTEAYTDIKNTAKYYGEENGRDGAHFTFNFQFITKLNTKSNARDVVFAVKEWLAYMPLNRVANWVLGNHDNHRVASRFGIRNIDGFNMLNGFLPGVMVTYNGEEIGLENGEPTWKDCKDPRACNGKEEDYEKFSRDFERTPFHWNSSVNAGFNDGNKTWLPVSKKYTKVNLELQKRPNNPSHYHVFKELVKLRKERSLTDGTLKIEALSDNVLMCVRALKDSDTYVLLFNVGSDTEAFKLDEILNNVTPYLKVVMTDISSYRLKDELIPSTNFLIGGNEAVVVKYTEDISVTTTEEPDEGGDGAAELTISIVLLTASLFCLLSVK